MAFSVGEKFNTEILKFKCVEWWKKRAACGIGIVSKLGGLLKPEIAPLTPLDAVRNRLAALVHLWMSVWDQNTGDAAPLLDLLSPEGFTITLTQEKQVYTTIPEVKAWFAKFPKQVAHDVHVVESIDITPEDDGSWRVVVHIAGRGTAVTGELFSVRSLHDWNVVDYGGFLPRIRRMTVALTHT